MEGVLYMDELTSASQYIQQYNISVQDLTENRLEKVADQIRVWRTEVDNSVIHSGLIEILRRLLSLRMSLKSGQVTDGMENLLSIDANENKFLCAEKAFVLGLYYFHIEKWISGSVEFNQAAPIYAEIGSTEKSLLSRYNEYIGLVNGEQMPDLLDQYACLGDIEKAALSANCKKILAWVLRQKSYLLYDEGRFAGSLNVILEATAIFRISGPESDFQLAVLHAADCYYHLGQTLQAQMEVEKVPSAIDARVEFAREYIMSMLHGTAINMERYRVRPPVWEKRYLNRSKEKVQDVAQWDVKTGVLSIGDKKVLLKSNSKESCLLRLLIKRQQSKFALCEMLWPEQMQVQTLDNRLHQLITRLNKKANLVNCKSGIYSLAQPIRAI
jgi:hypothetical protein